MFHSSSPAPSLLKSLVPLLQQISSAFDGFNFSYVLVEASREVNAIDSARIFTTLVARNEKLLKVITTAEHNPPNKETRHVRVYCERSGTEHTAESQVFPPARPPRSAQVFVRSRSRPHLQHPRSRWMGD